MRDNFSVTTCAPAGEKRRTVAICSPDLSLSSMASMERMRANATLFAAAPELLEALEGLLKIRSGRTVKVAKAAIAKARGEQA